MQRDHCINIHCMKIILIHPKKYIKWNNLTKLSWLGLFDLFVNSCVDLQEWWYIENYSYDNMNKGFKGKNKRSTI